MVKFWKMKGFEKLKEVFEKNGFVLSERYNTPTGRTFIKDNLLIQFSARTGVFFIVDNICSQYEYPSTLFLTRYTVDDMEKMAEDYERDFFPQVAQFKPKILLEPDRIFEFFSEKLKKHGFEYDSVNSGIRYQIYLDDDFRISQWYTEDILVETRTVFTFIRHGDSGFPDFAVRVFYIHRRKNLIIDMVLLPEGRVENFSVCFVDLKDRVSTGYALMEKYWEYIETKGFAWIEEHKDVHINKTDAPLFLDLTEPPEGIALPPE